MNLLRSIGKQGYNVRLIHDRNPPKELEFIGGDCYDGTKYKGLKFNRKKIPDEYLHKFTVLYIYKNPINSIYSRLHRDNISKFLSENEEVIKLSDVIEQKRIYMD